MLLRLFQTLDNNNTAQYRVYLKKHTKARENLEIRIY